MQIFFKNLLSENILHVASILLKGTCLQAQALTMSKAVEVLLTKSL